MNPFRGSLYQRTGDDNRAHGKDDGAVLL